MTNQHVAHIKITKYLNRYKSLAILKTLLLFQAS